MSIRTILVHAGDGEGVTARLGFAVALAEAHDALLIGASADRPMPIVVEGTLTAPWPREEEMTVVREELQRHEQRFKRELPASLKSEWRSAIDEPSYFIIRQARGADLVVLGPREASYNFLSLDPASVILQAGRPVLFVPKGIEKPPHNHALVAWKDSREARRAVADAIPLLSTFRSVSVVSIVGETDRSLAEVEAPLDDVVAFLARHGIGIQVHTFPQEGSDAGKQILAEAEKRGADLIVAGAYGHTRLGEWIFGGVTRDLLLSSAVPCLFSH